jgi:hypothetical protein
MRNWILILLFILFTGVLSNATKKIQANPHILYPAYFIGLANRDTIKLQELINSGRMVVRASHLTISAFTITIECPENDIVTRRVQSDSLSGEDIKELKRIRQSSWYLISFDAITFKEFPRQVAAGDPFGFYVRK